MESARNPGGVARTVAGLSPARPPRPSRPDRLRQKPEPALPGTYMRITERKVRAMNESSKRVLGLSRHLAPMVSPDRQMKIAGTQRSERLANAILADPQAHVDALVAAGVLEEAGDSWVSDGRTLRPVIMGYHVMPPQPLHEHDWRLRPSLTGVQCVTCGAPGRIRTDAWNGGPENWPRISGEASPK